MEFEDLKKNIRPGLNDKDFNEMIGCFDPKGTGRINYKEFLREMLGK